MSTRVNKKAMVKTGKQDDSLKIDEKYHSTQIQQLFSHVEKSSGNAIPAYVLKYTKTLYDAEGKAKSLLFDLIDIYDKKDERKTSLLGLNTRMSDLQNVRRVFVSNTFFLNGFLANEEAGVKISVVEFSDVKLDQSFQTTDTAETKMFYTWTTTILTKKTAIYRALAKWNTRIATFEHPTRRYYIFNFDIEDSEESSAEEIAPVAKRNPYNKK